MTRDSSTLGHFGTDASEVSGYFGTNTEVSEGHFGPKYGSVQPHGPNCPASDYALYKSTHALTFLVMC